MTECLHLSNDEDIKKFIDAGFKVLSEEGKLTIQILNYQHILDSKIKTLPLIDNEHVRFERNYEFKENVDLIDFNTKLTIKATGQEINNSVKLYPITKNKLQKLLEDAGFTEITFSGSFNNDPFSETGLTLLVTGKKPK